jgi:hemerythrin
MNTEDLVQWSDSLSTGIDEIDKQHKFLVSTLNEANRKLAADASRQTLEQILVDLIGYAIYHFEIEESLMKLFEYEAECADDATLHIQDHRSFAQRMAAWRNDMRNGLEVDGNEILQFLKQWLTNHILGRDHRMAQWVLAKQKT